ncbi:MAG: ATP-dependent Clp protease ATP-binding subunit [Patescibacteria group bacterium]
MNLNFNKSEALNFKKYRALRNLASFPHSVIYILSIALLIISPALMLFGYNAQNPLLTNIATFALGVSILLFYFYAFSRSYNRPIEKIDSANIAESLNEHSIEVVEKAFDIAGENNFSAVSPIVILAGLEQSERGRYMLLRAGFGIEKDLSGMISDAILEVAKAEKGSGNIALSEESLAVFEAARQNTILHKRNYVSVGDILIGLIQKSDIFKKMMFEIRVEEGDMQKVVEWYELLLGFRQRHEKPFWDREIAGGIGRDWSFGYTPTLNQFARNLNQEVEYSGEVHVYGRAREIDEIERVLAKSSQSNALLIGEHGIGKKTIVRGFVSRIVFGQVLPVLRYKQVFQVDTGALLSGSSDPGEIAGRVTKIFNEAVRAGNIILFFDNFHALLSSKEGVGQVNVSEILMPYLNGSINIIGTTTIKNYHKDIEANPGVAQALNRIEVREPNADQTLQVLEEMIPIIEARDGVFWPYQSLKEAVRVASRYIQNMPFPQKAIEIVDEVSVQIAKAGRKIILAKDIDDLMSRKLEVPVAQAEGKEAQKLLQLEEFLHMRVIGQNEAIEAVANAMRRARSGIQNAKRPIGTFLFLGPTGVGKTETSKALAEAYFGSEKSMIRVDMSEYQEASSVYRLIGSPPAGGAEGEKGQLTTAVVDNPFALILLDEIEKAHPNILTLFLQVFDDGRLTDSNGRTVDFNNTIIISTSNAGSELIRQNIQKGIHGEQMKKSLLDFLQVKGIFRPEFLNRFDAVVAFHPLSEDQIVEVAKLMLDQLSQRMAEKEITVTFTQKAIVKLAKEGFDPVYGARPMRRAIQDKVENVLAQSILAGKVPRGSQVTIDEGDIA